MSESAISSFMDFFGTDCLTTCIFTFLRCFWLWRQFHSLPYYMILNYTWGRNLLMCHGICPNISHHITTVKNNRIFCHITWPICSSTSLHICHIILTLLVPQVHYISNGFLGLLWQMMSSDSCRTMTLSLSLLYHILWRVASIKLISPCWCFEIINSGDLEVSQMLTFTCLLLPYLFCIFWWACSVPCTFLIFFIRK